MGLPSPSLQPLTLKGGRVDMIAQNCQLSRSSNIWTERVTSDFDQIVRFTFLRPGRAAFSKIRRTLEYPDDRRFASLTWDSRTSHANLWCSRQMPSYAFRGCPSPTRVAVAVAWFSEKLRNRVPLPSRHRKLPVVCCSERPLKNQSRRQAAPPSSSEEPCSHDADVPSGTTVRVLYHTT